MGLLDIFKKHKADDVEVSDANGYADYIGKTVDEAQESGDVADDAAAQESVIPSDFDRHEPVVVLEDYCEVCNIHAFVEKSDNCYYFYLWKNPESDNPLVKSCWICNRVEGTDDVDAESMQNGEAPRMPKQYVAHAPEGIELSDDKLSIVWFEEGDAAALLMDDEIICVIPGWNGAGGFYGYSRYAKGKGPQAWELAPTEDSFKKRIERCREFWKFFEREFWPEVKEEKIKNLEAFYGNYERYADISGNGILKRGLVQGSKDGVVYATTVGMSMVPMPKSEQFFGETNKDNRRAELGMAVKAEHSELIDFMGRRIAAITDLPWKQESFFAHGHAIPFEDIDGVAALLLVNSKYLKGAEVPVYEPFMGENVNLLWLVPVTQAEFDYARSNGIDKLLECAVDIDTIHIFDGKGKFAIG